MPRMNRLESSTGMYHVTVRGVNKLPIFKEKEDNIKFIKTVARYKTECGFVLHALVLMKTHAHFLIEEEDVPIGEIFQRMMGSYAMYYNKAHERIGHLYQARYWSKPIEDLPYYFKSMWYIYQNPVKKDICRHPQNYIWSTLQERGPMVGLVDNEIHRFVSPERLQELLEIQNTVAADVWIARAVREINKAGRVA